MSEDSKPRTFKSRTGREIPRGTGDVNQFVRRLTPREMVRIAEGREPAEEDSLAYWIKEARRRERAAEFASERERLISQFRELRNAANSATKEKQTVIAVGLAMNWRDFLNLFGGTHNFSYLDKSVQMEYYNKLISSAAYYDQRSDGEKIVPVLIMISYLWAIIEKDYEFEQEVAGFCDIYVRRGWPIASAI